MPFRCRKCNNSSKFNRMSYGLLECVCGSTDIETVPYVCSRCNADINKAPNRCGGPLIDGCGKIFCNKCWIEQGSIQNCLTCGPCFLKYYGLKSFVKI